MIYRYTFDVTRDRQYQQYSQASLISHLSNSYYMRLVLTSTKLKSLVMVVRKRLFYFPYEMPPNFQTF